MFKIMTNFDLFHTCAEESKNVFSTNGESRNLGDILTHKRISLSFQLSKEGSCIPKKIKIAIFGEATNRRDRHRPRW